MACIGGIIMIRVLVILFYLDALLFASNALIHEAFPYLRQHSDNPVNWVAWNASGRRFTR